MPKEDFMEISTRDELYARSIGWSVLTWLKAEHQEVLPYSIEGDAARVLEKIKTILDDDTLDDPDCFQRIDRIVRTFYANGLYTTRHDW